MGGRGGTALTGRANSDERGQAKLAKRTKHAKHAMAAMHHGGGGAPFWPA